MEDNAIHSVAGNTPFGQWAHDLWVLRDENWCADRLTNRMEATYAWQ